MHYRNGDDVDEDPMGRSWMRKTISVAAGVGFAVFMGVVGIHQAQKTFRGLSRQLETSEVTLIQTREELTTLRRENRESLTLIEKHQEISTHLLENASRETEIRMGILEEKLRSNRELTREEFLLLRRSLKRDPEKVRKMILSPSIQVTAQSGVGGGTVIGSRRKNENEYEIFIITAFHVLEKAVSEKEGSAEFQPVEVRIYAPNGKLEEEQEANIIAYHREKDLAILCLERATPFPIVAKLASRETLQKITVFTPVYAVGCPLGHPPLPSPGEISNLQKEVDGEKFWMMNAPTFFGNSGGGIFHRETHELVGISAMICTYDGFVSVPVPHLGIMVSLETVYEWLDSQYLQYVYNKEFTPQLCRQLRRAASRPHPPRPMPQFRY